MSATDATDVQQATDDLRTAFSDLLGAERRLRSRDPQRPGSVSYAQVRALIALADEDDAVTAGQLARLAGLTPGSVTTMLDALEAKRIVERRRSTSDRRVVVVSLTPEGRELVAEKRARWRARWDEVCADLSEEQVRGAAEVMRRMTRMFDDL